MIDALIILSAAAGRYWQGNGYGWQGRAVLIVAMALAAWFGPLDGQHLSWVETWAAFSLAAAGAITVLAGYTDWGNWKYSLLRYTGLVAIVALTTWYFTGRDEFLYYIGIGPVLTAIYYFVAEHKPAILSKWFGNRDIAAALAGATVGCLVLI